MKFIDCISITNNISNLHYFCPNYYNKYIVNFTKNNNCYNLDTNNIKKILSNNKELIFITKIEYLDNFYNTIIPLLTTKFILITHYGDLDSGLNNNIITHPLLIKWYGINMAIKSNKTEAIPLGLESVYWKRTNLETIKNYKNSDKTQLLYVNFSLNTHPNRKKIMNIILNKGFILNNKLPWNQYIKDLSKHKFCICPRGNGVDCHRIWECLYLNVIPIVEKSIYMDNFNTLPILFIDNYECISCNYLNKVYKIFKNKKFNLEKLDLKYWENKIKTNYKRKNS